MFPSQALSCEIVNILQNKKCKRFFAEHSRATTLTDFSWKPLRFLLYTTSRFPKRVLDELWKIIHLYQLNKMIDPLLNFQSYSSFLKFPYFHIEICLISWCQIFRHHSKHILKCYLSLCGITNLLKLMVLKQIWKNSQINILNSNCS